MGETCIYRHPTTLAQCSVTGLHSIRKRGGRVGTIHTPQMVEGTAEQPWVTWGDGEWQLLNADYELIGIRGAAAPVGNRYTGACGRTHTHNPHYYGEEGEGLCSGYTATPAESEGDEVTESVHRAGEWDGAERRAKQSEREAGRLQDQQAAMTELAGWWEQHADAAVGATVPKAVEYGAHDLDVMAAGMIALVADKLAGATDAEKMQWGRYAACAFYELGKVGRMFGALAEGKLPKEDTEFDLEVYSVMAARIRQTGKWV